MYSAPKVTKYINHGTLGSALNFVFSKNHRGLNNKNINNKI